MLERLPQELHQEIINHLPVAFHDADQSPSALQYLSNCNRKWRLLCIPLLFQKINMDGKSNAAITRFLVYNAARYGDYVRTLSASTFPPEELPKDERLMVGVDLSQDSLCRWSHTRDHLLHALISFLPDLTSLSLSIRRDYIWQQDGPAHNSRIYSIERTALAVSNLVFLRSLHLNGPFSDVMANCFLEKVVSRIESITVALLEWEDLVGYSTSESLCQSILQSSNLTTLIIHCLPDIRTLAGGSPLLCTNLKHLELSKVKLHLTTLGNLVSRFESSLTRFVITECNIDQSPITTTHKTGWGLPFPNLIDLRIVNLMAAMDTQSLLNIFCFCGAQTVAISTQVHWLDHRWFKLWLRMGTLPMMRTLLLKFPVAGEGWTGDFVKEIEDMCAERGATTRVEYVVSRFYAESY